jgi:hypothetical protein
MKNQNYNIQKSYRIEKNAKWFMDILPYHQNRETETRLSKISCILKTTPLPTQLEVAVGKVTKPFGPYKEGDYFRLNGNTRCEVWMVRPELMPDSVLDVKVYEVNSHEYARTLYDSFDSSDSVETPSQKVTGYLRERNYKPNNNKIKKGSFKTSIINACRYGHDENGVYLNGKEYNNKFDVKLDYYWKELVKIDSFPLNELNKDSGNVMTAFLMILKKYGVNNKKFDLLFNNFKDSITTYSLDDNVDGVNYVFNVLYPQNHLVWTQTGFSNSFTLISKILYGFDMFMRDETICKKDKQKEKFFRDFYQNYLTK